MVLTFPGSLLSQLRLPTPPRDFGDDITGNVDEAISYLDASLSNSPLAKQTLDHDCSGQTSLDTPPSSSPLPPSKSQDALAAKRPKRLRFSAETSFCEAEVKPLPPSKDQIASKSILKPFDQILSSNAPDQAATLLAPHRFADFATMLESVVKELAGHDHASQHDAYLTLWRSIKAHQDLPDTNALLGKLSLLEQFMMRDIAQTNVTVSNKKLRLQALQLASTLVWRLPPWNDSSFKSGVSGEFLLFLINQAIHALEDKTVAKEFLRHQLVILTMHEAYTKVMNIERSTKILKLLSNIHERITGNSIIQLRLMICRQITQYQPAGVVDEANGVLPYVLHGLLSSDKETRLRAIETGLALGACIGHRRRVAHAIRSTLQDNKSSSFASYTGHFEKRLGELMANSDDSHQVPQIWGLLMLMLRGDANILREWLARKPWLKVIEHCFNSSDTGLNLHAWTAWNRTIFSAHRLMLEHESVLKRLCQPIFGHLHRNSSSESTISAIKAAYSSYYLILYYAFGQKLDSSKTQFLWEHLIGEMCQRLSSKRTVDCHRFALALRALFTDSSLKVWNSERGLQTSKASIQWDEVPRLDSMWIRRNLGLVIKSLQPLLDRPQNATSESEFTCVVWTSMMKAISQAGEKEIKASSEFRGAFAEILNFLSHFWSTNRNVRGRFEDSGTTQITVFLGFVQSAIENLSPMQWGQNVLLRAPDGMFEAASTPSKNLLQSSVGPQQCCPIVSIVRLLSTQPPDTLFSPSFRNELSAILKPCLDARPTRQSKIDLIDECVASLQSPEVSGQRAFVAHIWQVLATIARSVMKDRSFNKDDFIWRSYQQLLYILRFGLYFSDFKSLEVGRSLFESMGAFSRQEGGDTGFLAAVAGPWLEILTKDGEVYNKSAVLSYLSTFLDADLPMPSWKAVERPRTSINKANKLARPSSDSWPEALVSALSRGLSCSYARLNVLDASAVDRFLSSSYKFLESSKERWTSSTHALEALFWRLEAGLLPWIRDVGLKVIKAQSRGYNIERSFAKLWEILLSFVAKLPSADNRMLNTLEDVLIAGFQSHDKLFANVTIEGWNRIFQDCTIQACPEKLGHVLTRLKLYTDIRIPSQDQQTKSDVMHASLPSEDTQLFPWLADERSLPLFDESELFQRGRHKSLTIGRVPILLQSSPASKNSTPTKSASKQTPPPRLRHDDSQVQFVAVESSPIHHATEQDSQFLTEHQRDVRSRQLADVAIFSDLRSSPIPDESKKIDRNGGPTASTSQAKADEHEPPMDPGLVPDQHVPRSRLIDLFDEPMVQPHDTSKGEETAASDDPPLEPLAANEQTADEVPIPSEQPLNTVKPGVGTSIVCESGPGELLMDTVTTAEENFVAAEPVPNDQPFESMPAGEASSVDDESGPSELLAKEARVVKETFVDESGSGKLPMETEVAAEETFFDAALVHGGDIDHELDRTETVGSIIESKLNDSARINFPLQDITPNTCSIPRTAKLIKKNSAEDPDDLVERVEESFVNLPNAVDPGSQDDDVSDAHILSSSPAMQSQSARPGAERNSEEDSQFTSISVVVPLPSFSVSEPSKARRGRKRKSSTTPLSSQQEKKPRPNPLPTESQPSQESDEGDGDVIIVEAPDESSPPLRTVLGRLGISIPGEKSPSASQTPSRKRGRPRSKLSQEIRDDMRGESRGDEESQGLAKRQSRSSRTSSQREGSQSESRQQGSPGSQAAGDSTNRKAASMVARLKAVIEEVEELEFDKETSSERSYLLELAAQLQRAVKAAVGAK